MWSGGEGKGEGFFSEHGSNSRELGVVLRLKQDGREEEEGGDLVCEHRRGSGFAGYGGE